MRLKTTVLTLALMALPLGANAAGLGKVTVLSALGQPLRAEIDITASREELLSMSARVATPNTFKQAGIEYSSTLAGVRLAVEKRPDGQPFLSMVSDRPVSEPFLDLLVELDWTSGRLVREYTFLLDPPEMLKKPAAASAAPVAVPEVRREAPAPAAVPAAAPALVAKQPDMPVAEPGGVPSSVSPGELQKTPRPEMKVIRGPDGVQRIVKAEPTRDKLAKETTRMVKYGDTLNQIASETKPEGVSLDQMLVALFLGNQDAFVGNVNRLKAGKIITIPDREAAAAVNAAEARTTVRAHTADFNAYRKKLAAAVSGAAAQQEEEPKRAVSGKIQPKVEDKAPAPLAGRDKLEVSKSEAARDAAGKAGSGRIAAIEETLIAREKALKEANSRIAELEKNLRDLKKLVELKSQGMAELQKQAQPVQPAAQPAPQTAPVAAAAKKPAAAPDVEKPAAKTPEATVQQPVQPPAPKPATPEKKPLPAPPPSQPEPSFVEQSPEIVYGGAAILALLLGYFGYSRWRKQRQADDQDTPVAANVGDLSDRSAFALSGGQLVDTDDLLTPTDFSSQSSMGDSISNAGVDPIAEADVYMAYGRDVQAEEILLDALKSDPTRNAIHLKLLEIYVARKSIKQAEAIATDLHTQTGGIGIDWEKAVQLGRQIDPDNPLYGAGIEAVKEFDSDSTMMMSTPEEEQRTEATMGELQSLDEEVAAVDVAQKPVEIPPVQEDYTESLDFELDLTADGQTSKTSGSASVAEAFPQSQDETSVPLDIDLDVEIATPATTAMEPVAVPPQRPEEPAQSLEMDVDLDLDLGTVASKSVVTDMASSDDAMKRQAATLETGDEMDFDFDLGGGKAAETPAITQTDEGNMIDFDFELPEPAATQPTTGSEDLASIKLEDIGAPTPAPSPAAAATAPKVDLSSISLELDQYSATSVAPQLDEAVFQEVATKLELALAYEEMGDREGARELLQEVINEGNTEQQQAARSKLAQLDR